jgi:hypothetical protein
LGQIVSVDFFTVPTIRLRVLFVFLVLEHRRREVLHFNVTEYPTSAWVAQQIVEAFADRETPRYLIRDRDGVYGNEVWSRLKSMGIGEVLTAPQRPWQNAYAERLIVWKRNDIRPPKRVASGKRCPFAAQGGHNGNCRNRSAVRKSHRTVCARRGPGGCGAPG